MNTSSFFVVLLLVAAAWGEVVQFESCPPDSEDEPAPAPNCTVHEVRISPCAEASENKPCKIKRGRSASIQFDFTALIVQYTCFTVPAAATETLTGRAFWTNTAGDLPFVGMNTDACSYTTCPVQANQRQTYDYQLSISRKFPVRAYDVKWKLWNEELSVFQCCFIAKIKLVK
ncbi:hypothetical protein C0J52_15517 [Blattella germanica]|nr:hypothetical protein C0J52_15517 [Blattella germanica]